MSWVSGGVVRERLGVPCDTGLTTTLPIIFCGSRWRANRGGAGSSWMRDEVLPIIPLPCLRASGGRVSAHLGKPRDWRQSSSQPCTQRPMSRGDWQVFPLKKAYYCESAQHVMSLSHWLTTVSLHNMSCHRPVVSMLHIPVPVSH
ncbi:hypothetical protein Hanom_Chr15g01343601 [Helianthus anomalus]